MASGGMNFSASVPQTLAVRPLSLGMVTEGSDVLLKPGTFTDLVGFDVTETGLRRHGGFEPIVRVGTQSIPVTTLFDDGQSFASRRLNEVPQDFFTLMLADGDTRSVVVTNRALYVVEATSGYTPVFWHGEYEITDYDGTGVDAIVKVAGDETTDSLLVAGDWLTFDNGTTYYYIKTCTYDNVGLKTVITLFGKPSVAPLVGAKFKIVKPFATSEDGFTDWCLGRNAAWLVDGVTACVFKYDGTYLHPMSVVEGTGGAQTMFGARTIAHFKERLYFGDVQDGSAGTLKARQRIRWSDVLGWGTSNTEIVSPAANYQDLAYKIGPMMKLIGLEELIMAFTTDAVFYGKATADVDLPYAFYEIQTGGVSAIGPKAVGGLLGGVIFVGQDDVYMVSLDQGYPVLSKVGSAVANTMLPPRYATKTVVRVDPLSSRVIFAMATLSKTYLDTLWCWNYRTKGWSYSSEMNLRGMASSTFVDQLRLNEVDPSWTIEGSPISGTTFDALLGTPGSVELFAYDANGHLVRYNRNGIAHRVSQSSAETYLPVQTVLETPDLDFDQPDGNKSFLGVGLRIKTSTTRDLAIKIRTEMSVDHGRTWRFIGYLTLGTTDDEDSLDFRATGSTVRFRLTSGREYQGTVANTAPWTIVELTVKVRVRGNEKQRGTLRGVDI